MNRVLSEKSTLEKGAMICNGEEVDLEMQSIKPNKAPKLFSVMKVIVCIVGVMVTVAAFETGTELKLKSASHSSLIASVSFEDFSSRKLTSGNGFIDESASTTLAIEAVPAIAASAVVSDEAVSSTLTIVAVPAIAALEEVSAESVSSTLTIEAVPTIAAEAVSSTLTIEAVPTIAAEAVSSTLTIEAVPMMAAEAVSSTQTIEAVPTTGEVTAVSDLASATQESDNDFFLTKFLTQITSAFSAAIFPQVAKADNVAAPVGAVAPIEWVEVKSLRRN